ncbi:MAG TPA: DUF4271 domain-containing protein [Chitinophagaceae bacterium]|nr:DUF4271 domain-containing protein [Chitinophagaceae bacterium]
MHLYFLPFVTAQNSDSSISIPKINLSSSPDVSSSPDYETDTTTLSSISNNQNVIVKQFDKREMLEKNDIFNMLAKGIFKIEKFNLSQRKDWLFYLIAGMLFLLAVLKQSYSKYYNNLFRLFFKTTFRQAQLKEQVFQAQLPSLLFNLFFFISAGTYLFLLMGYFDVQFVKEKWQQLGICIGLVSAFYLVKMPLLWIMGLVLEVKRTTETYTFIVLLVNKLLGILLVPFIIILAFGNSIMVNVALTLSLLMISGVFIYRMIRSYFPIHQDIKVSKFHFFLYLCAFDITPLLLIYKVLIKFF